MTNVDLVLLDCSSIQKYVFGSNKLKSNIGASYLVQSIFERWIPEVLKELFKKEPAEFADWRKTPKVVKMSHESPPLWETGYVGGGNALMLFQHDEKNQWAHKFVEAWTRTILLNAPGLHPAVAIQENVTPSVSDLSGKQIDDIFKELGINKNRYHAQTVLDRHGITAECNYSGLSAEVFHEDWEERGWISAEVKSKLNWVKEADEDLRKEYKDVLANKWHFSGDTENLGFPTGETSLIAVVHIDGNGMGAQFKDCGGLVERRILSREVDLHTKKTMETTISALIDKMPALTASNNGDFFHWKDTSKSYLPFRPIILNGDDITFICDARLGFFLAEVFMQAYAKTIMVQKEDGVKREVTLSSKKSTGPEGPAWNSAEDGVKREVTLSSCAGIAFIKAKYPFYRAYRLAERLCGNAKKMVHGDPKNKYTSWLDFHVAIDGISGDLEEIRKSYDLGDRTLLWRPWKMNDSNEKRDGYNSLKGALKDFTIWPNNKVYELKQALEQGEAATKAFIEHWKAKKADEGLPGWETEPNIGEGWTAHRETVATPYYDVIEAIKYYPEILLRAEEGK